MKPKKNLLLLICLIAAIQWCPAQKVSEKNRQAILAEGIELYKLELAAWNASDLLDSVYGYKTLDSIAGYVSYRQGNTFNCVYYGGPGNERIYAHFVFDSLSSIESAFLDLTPRKAGPKESALIALRENALKRINENEGGFFQKQKDVFFNLVPIITGSEKKVFILSAGDEGDYILLGNDYLLTYSKDNKLLSRKKLHSQQIKLPMESVSSDDEHQETSHTHKESESGYIAPTDICTLLLYAEYFDWDKHLVFSPQFVSIFDLTELTLKILPRKDYEQQKAK